MITQIAVLLNIAGQLFFYSQKLVTGRDVFGVENGSVNNVVKTIKYKRSNQ